MACTPRGFDGRASAAGRLPRPRSRVLNSNATPNTADHEVVRAWWFGGSFNPGSLPQVAISDEDFAALGQFDQLHSLIMVVGVMTDAGLAQIGGLPRLEKVYCFKPRVTNACLSHLRGSTSLRPGHRVEEPY